MKNWKRVWICAALFAAMISMSVMAQAGGGARGERGAGAGGQRMSPEERAKITKQATPLVAKAVAQYLKLSKEEAEKFTAAYVKEVEAAEKRSADAPDDQDREARMARNTEDREKMTAMLKANLTEEQVEKATPLLGRFNSLGRSVESLVRAEVDTEKIEKALPILVEYSLETQKLFASTFQRGGGAAPDEAAREEMRTKMTAINEKLTKDITPIVGEEAATALTRRGFFGGPGMGGGQRGGGQRGGGGAE